MTTVLTVALCSASASAVSAPAAAVGDPAVLTSAAVAASVEQRATADRASRNAARADLNQEAARRAAVAAAALAYVQEAQRAEATAKAASGVAKTVPAPPPVQPAGGTPDQNRELGRFLALQHGWDESEFSCLDRIWTQESGWRVTADNPSSSAYGIPQALPGSKMASAGADWETNPATQIEWGLGYIGDRYGTPCSASNFKFSHGWY